MSVATTSTFALVVDDSAAMRRQLADALARAGIASDVAVHGADAWRLLQEERYDVVLTDINMPVLDGLKLIRLVRSGGAHREVPIVVVSAEGGAADQQRAIALGANAYLVKPIRADDVAGTVRALVDAGR